MPYAIFKPALAIVEEVFQLTFGLDFHRLLFANKEKYT